MPSERSPFGSPVEPISPPPKPASMSGLGWRRRVPPPGPKDLFRCPFIAIAALAGDALNIGDEGGAGKGGRRRHVGSRRYVGRQRTTCLVGAAFWGGLDAPDGRPRGCAHGEVFEFLLSRWELAGLNQAAAALLGVSERTFRRSTRA